MDPSVTKRETGTQSLRLEEPRGFISDPCAGFPFIPAFRRHVCTQLCVEAERGSQLGSEAARLARQRQGGRSDSLRLYDVTW